MLSLMADDAVLLPVRIAEDGTVTEGAATAVGLRVGDSRRRHERGVRLAAVVMLRQEGHSVLECAKILDVSTWTIKNYLRVARRTNVIPSGLESGIERLRNEIVTDAIETVGRRVAKGDLETSLKVIEGVGAFTAKVREGATRPHATSAPTVNIQIVNAPEGGHKPSVGGVPNT